MDAPQQSSALLKAVSQDITLGEGASFLSQDGVDALCLRDGEGRAVGVFAHQDLAKAVAAQVLTRTPAKDWARPVREDCGLAEDNAATDAPEVNLTALPMERLLYDILNSLYNPVLAVDVEGTTIFCNPAMAAVAHSTVKDLLGKRAEDFVANTRLPRIILTGQSEPVRKITIGQRTYLTNRTPIKDGEQVIGALAVLQDISELAAIADQLERTKELTSELDAIIESSFDGIYVTDGEGRTIRVNKAYERITGLQRGELLNRKMQELVEEGFYNQSVTLRVLETQRAESLMQSIRTGKTVMVTGTPIFDKPGKVSLVVTSVRDVTELYNLQGKLEREEKLRTKYESELERLRRNAEDDNQVVVQSGKMREVYELALRLANVDTTVLVQGESGVGKEVFADIIHRNSQRREGPLVKISCAAIPEQLLESELFGYQAAAFTGASKQGKLGIFEAAKGGTIFLDEIGELPLGLQAKLLRVLQAKEVIRVGSSVAVPVDVRIVAATNRDLQDMVRRGQYRQDLFFRLNVVPVVIPPLRHRKDGIPKLFYHFLNQFNRRYEFGKQVDPKVLQALYDYDWPGNVRELMNTIERMVVTTQGEVIAWADMPDYLKKAAKEPSQDPEVLDGSLKATLEAIEKQILARALRIHKSTYKAAQALGVNQSTVVRKMKRLGIRLKK
ncbi:MAG: sigma 54-interacting transcriptional regulator [Deltaproteobacteria bacterium]|nr:sigma 54-interacting transcriptional regulator [Deltaproteobacteria bacterium]